ncbi:hypothetical protein DFH05DRAFT_1038596 [Lentinula detonsa]|uniref:C2H2-type domain-containing protein n=1 Tax=Lentinula detonsa TaxID=2804962 RepID=A0A9W8P2C8_9AGAR|nr:hypothetical protein DFH05DRAFT_1038596 [Lentinula detonsa]
MFCSQCLSLVHSGLLLLSKNTRHWHHRTKCRPELVELYLNFCRRSESFGVCPWSMQEWYADTKVFSGEKRQFEAWFWNTPEGTLSPLESQPFVRVVDVPEMRSFPCFYPGCPKQAEPYRTKQNRDNHFDSTHLGVRFSCPLSSCGEEFKNKGSVKRHRDRFGH